MSKTIARSTGVIGGSLAINIIGSYFIVSQMQKEWFHIQLEMAKFEKAAEEAAQKEAKSLKAMKSGETIINEYSEYDPNIALDGAEKLYKDPSKALPSPFPFLNSK